MIMPLVATIMIFIFFLGLGMLKIGFGSRFTAARTSSEIMARSAADAGLGVAMFEIKKRNANGAPPPWIINSSDTLPNPTNPTKPRASYEFSVAPSNTGHANSYFIRSVGRADGQARTVYAATWATSFWSFALLVDDTITLKSKTILDVYPLGSTPLPPIGTTSTEPGAITLAPNTNVPGDVVVGAGADPDTVISSKKTSEIQGDMYASDSDIEFPPVSVPGGLLPPALVWPADPDPNTILGSPGIITSYSYQSDISLANSESLYVNGNVAMYVAGDMRLFNGATLYIEAESSLELYLGGSLTADNSVSIITADQEAKDLQIFGTPTCTIIDLKNSGDLWAAVYAPSADILIYNSGKTCGSFVGNSFEMKEGAEFYYDTRLLEGEPTNEPKFFMIQRWWERGDDVL